LQAELILPRRQQCSHRRNVTANAVPGLFIMFRDIIVVTSFRLPTSGIYMLVLCFVGGLVYGVGVFIGVFGVFALRLI
jgi:hypothetical protein